MVTGIHLILLANPHDKSTTLIYDPLNRRAIKQLGNGDLVSPTWAAAGQLTQLVNLGSGGTTVNHFISTYDNADGDDLVADRLTRQQQLIEQRRSRTTPIQVTRDGVI